MTWVFAFNTACCLLALIGLMAGVSAVFYGAGFDAGWDHRESYVQREKKSDE